MKICIKCTKEKDIDDFYAHPQMTDGHLGKCKSCCKKDATVRRNSKLEEVRAYDRIRGNEPGKVKYRRENPPSKEARVRANQKYNDDNKLKRRAHNAVNNALHAGTLVKEPCEVCGETKTEGHHDDYSLLLSVRWLCDFHHKQHHRVERERLRSPGLIANLQLVSC